MVHSPQDALERRRTSQSYKIKKYGNKKIKKQLNSKEGQVSKNNNQNRMWHILISTTNVTEA